MVEGGHRASATGSPPAGVLNAFRRHGRGRMSAVLYVLGSLGCAQRLSASWSRAGSVGRLGVIGGLFDVLNAFRRHGRGRALLGGKGPGAVSCSTPFGVMVEGGQSGFDRTAAAAGCAQRLSASWSRAARSRTTMGASRSVLNAFRRHGRGRIATAIQHGEKKGCSTPFGVMVEGGISTWRDQKLLPCAQRRSASWSRADRAPAR